MRLTFWMALVVVSGVAIAMACTFQVNQSEAVILARLGNPREPITEPGLYFKWPTPIDTIYRVDHRLRVFESELNTYLTQDKKNIVVGCFLAWRVKDPAQFIASVKDTERAGQRLGDILNSEVGAILGEYELSALVSEELESSALMELNSALTRRVNSISQQNFGVTVDAARVRRLNFHRQNMGAVFETMRADRQKAAKIIRSEATRAYEKLTQDAMTEAAKMESKANQEATEIKGKARADAVRILAEAHSQDPALFEFLQRIDSMEKMVDDQSTFVVPSDWDLMNLLKGPPSLEVQDERDQ